MHLKLGKCVVQVITGKRQDAFARNHRKKDGRGNQYHDSLVSTYDCCHKTSNDGANINHKGNDNSARGITVVDEDDDRISQRQTSDSNGVFIVEIKSLQLSTITHIYDFVSSQIKLRQKDKQEEDRGTFASGLSYPPNHFLRLVHLEISFTPVLSTAKLAAVSG